MAQTPKGRAIIEVLLDSTKLEKQLRAVEDNFKRVGANILKVGAGFTGFGAGLLGALTIAANEAGDAAEIFNKFEIIFKGASKEVRAFAQEVAKSIGRTETDVASALATYQSFFIGLGKGDKEARELSKTLTVLALDFASFNNLSDTEAQQRFISGLSGSAEVFDRYGINIKAAALDQELLRQGINKTTATANENEKVMARLAIIMESLGKQGAVGDAVRTADSYNNVLKRLSASFTELKQTIGDEVTKDLASFNASLAKSINSITKFIKENPGLVTSVLGIGVAAVGVGAALSALGITFIGIGATIAALTTIVSSLFSALSLVATVSLATLTSPLTSVAIILGAILVSTLDLREAFSDVSKAIKSDFGGAIESAKGNLDLLKRAVAAGDLKLAFQILAKSAELFFRQSFSSIRNLWSSIVGGFLIGINNIVTAWGKLILDIDAMFLVSKINSSKTADAIVNTFRAITSPLRAIFIGVLSEIQILWLNIKALFEAGLKFKKRDVSGIREVFEELNDQKEMIRKSAAEQIKAELNLNFDVDSQTTKDLEKALGGNDSLLNDLLAQSKKQELKILNDLGDKVKADRNEIDKLVALLGKLGIAVGAAEAKLLRDQKNKKKDDDDKGTINAIKSIAPQFGSLVETGSSAALKLFASNQNPMVKEQQKTNKALGIIADNTAGLTTA